MGTCDTMRQNPWNGVMHLGHSNGVVSMWTPNVTTAVVKMLCHRVRAKPTQCAGHHDPGVAGGHKRISQFQGNTCMFVCIVHAA